MSTDLRCETARSMSRRTSVARDVVTMATRAPSLHNTQPWRWRIVSDDLLELFADHDRQLPLLDPRGRLLTVSLGAALHHAVVAARAVDREVSVERFPTDGPPDLVARVHLGERRLAGPAERIALASLVARRTDRRPFTSWALPERRLRQLGRLATAYGVTTVRLDARQRIAVERLVAAAAAHHEGLLGFASTEEGDTEHTAALALCHPDDGPAGWLASGEAMSAVWLDAVSDGLGAVPISLPVEVAEVRDGVRADVLGLLAHPQLLLQIGWPHTASVRLPPSPRRPLDDVIIP